MGLIANVGGLWGFVASGKGVYMDVSNEFQGENCCQVSILDAARSRDVDAFFQEISICKVVRISLSDLADLGREELAFYSKFRIQALRRGLEVRVDR